MKKIIEKSISEPRSVEKLEIRFNDLMEGNMHSVGVPNAALGILACLIALGIKAQDKIIITPYSPGSTIAGAKLLGCELIFTDINPLFLSLEPHPVWNIIEKQNDIKCIIDCDIYGYPALSNCFEEVKEKYGVPYILDCSMSLGANLDFHHTGFMADFAVFSFNETNFKGTGQGGMVCVKDWRRYEKLLQLTQDPERTRRDYPTGLTNPYFYDFRLNAFTAGSVLSRLDGFLKKVEAKRKWVSESRIPVLASNFAPCNSYQPSYSTLVANIHKVKNRQPYEFDPPPILKLHIEDPNLYRSGCKMTDTTTHYSKSIIEKIKLLTLKTKNQ